ncbi:xanthine dehydrogenase family protein molybdopterin-binding subunit [Emergencia sp. JLR.KK010]|jgi:xanthine dehydrogenase molybdenum-binding subunit|uniref:xanthine dehydrogenase family protein molybdopterin-binding subunit n=1 Tax=Emergencia sp. JLR.KK010 TaxID=3114296 RepID=UPI0030CE8FF3
MSKDRIAYVPREQKRYMGTYRPKIDAKEKTLGKTQYLDDITLKGKLPGMLYAKILQCPYPHARILKMNTTKAEELPGVFAVLRYDDEEIRALGRTTHAWTDIAITPKESDTITRYWDRDFLPQTGLWVGDHMGVAVAAETPEIADEALKLIDIKWEIFPAVYEMDEAKKPDAPILHPELNPSTNQLRHSEDGIENHLFYKRGDVEKSLREADFVLEVEKTYGGVSTHGCLEYRGCVIRWDEDKMDVWTNHYMSDQTRMYLHDYTHVPLNKIRVRNGNSGAHMGKWNTGEDIFFMITAYLSKRAGGRPVRYKMTNHEEFHETRSENRYKIKAACTNSGKITGMEMIAEGNSGAYIGGCDHNVEFIVSETMNRAFAPVEHVSLYSYTWFTNKVPGGVVRGIGNVQLCWCFMSLLDELAERTGIDVIDIIKLNCTNDFNWPGEKNRSICRVLDEGAKIIGWKNRHKAGEGQLIEGCKKRGMGVAVWNQWHAELNELTRGFYEVSIRLNPDMSVIIQAPTSETGAGGNSAAVFACAENLHYLNIKPEDILWTPLGDTELGLRDNAPTDSVVSFLYAEAMAEGAQKLKSEILRRVGEYMEKSPEELEIEDGYVFEKVKPENRIGVEWFMLHTDCVPIHIHHARHNVREEAGLPFGAWFADVEVDIETGQVEVTDMVVLNDVGCVMHASGAESHQISGQAMGIGEVLFEELHYDKETGTVLNNNYIDYKMMTMADFPKQIIPVLIEEWKGLGKYGAAGMAEGAFTGAGAAIANAIYNAVGIRIDDQSITPAKVLNKLMEKGGNRA